jgi:phosphopantothenoylcysteine synthetase/decarboxylase
MVQSALSKRLENVTVLITAGPMRAYLDAVRYISNVSTGRLGAEIARECLARGAAVTFVHGPNSRLPTPPPGSEDRLTLIEIDTLGNLTETLREALRGGGHRICFHAMAVLDYVPEETVPGKFSAEAPKWSLTLVRSPKVIEQIKKMSPATLLVGFKLEVDVSVERLIERAKDLMDRSGAEIVVANDLSRINADHHPATICYREEERIGTRAVDGKPQIARALCDLVEARMERSGSEIAATESRSQ